MNETKKWFREKSVWRIILMYSLGSWVGLGHLDLLTARFGVPDWVFNVSVFLSLLGLIGITFVAAAIKREIPLRRFVNVGLGYLFVAFVGLQAADFVIRSDAWATVVVLIFLLLLPMALFLSLFWPPRRKADGGEGTESERTS
jgi:hypothetical protein